MYPSYYLFCMSSEIGQLFSSRTNPVRRMHRAGARSLGWLVREHVLSRVARISPQNVSCR